MIVKYAFAVGLVVRRGNRLFEFDRKLSDNTVIFIDALDKCPHRWQISDVHKDVQSGKLTVVLGDSEPKCGAEPDGLPMLINIESLPAKHRDAINKKIDYVLAPIQN